VKLGGAWLCLASAISANSALAAGPVAPAAPARTHDPPPAPEYRVDFRADRVEVEPETFELELHGNVIVKVARYRIKSEELSLSRGPRGLEVDGEGEVALCPCAGAPVTLGFQSLTVAPPTDVLLESPTVRLGGVPVLWLPFLWLRAKDRLGLLPPWVEWRGEDGLLVGAGAHVPFEGRSARGRVSALDLRAGGYFEGGARVDASLDLATSRTRVVWDKLDGAALRIDSAGQKTLTDGPVIAWYGDTLRGDRARRYPSSLDQASRRYDRLGLSVASADRLVYGAGFGSTAARGSDFDDFGAVGPGLHFGGGGPLGSDSSADVAFDVSTLRTDSGAESQLGAEALFELETPAAPFSVGATLRQRALVSTTEAASGSVLTSGLFPRVSLPLMRRYEPFTHVIEPEIAAAQIVSVTSGAPSLAASPELPGASTRGDDGLSLWVARAGVENTLGGLDNAVSLLLTGGLVGGDDAEPAGAMQLRSDLGPLGLSLQGTVEEDGATGIGRARVGKREGLHVGAHGEARTESSSAAAQWLLPDAWDSPAPFLARSGVSAGGDLAVPVGEAWEGQVGGDFDVSTSDLLAVYGSIAFHHPCGCLGATAWAGHRRGRDGFDAWLSVDLLP
jgi:hypothetical protein